MNRKLIPKQIKELINYWWKTSEHDNKTMLILFKHKHYSDSLFFGHIVLEKILKAHVVKYTNKEAPRIHDLVELSKRANLNLNQEELEYLKIVNRFNMRTRYPDVKLRFYKQCTLEYTQEHLDEINKLYKKLCQQFKQKK